MEVNMQILAWSVQDVVISIWLYGYLNHRGLCSHCLYYTSWPHLKKNYLECFFLNFLFVSGHMMNCLEGYLSTNLIIGKQKNSLRDGCVSDGFKTDDCVSKDYFKKNTILWQDKQGKSYSVVIIYKVFKIFRRLFCN